MRAQPLAPKTRGGSEKREAVRPTAQGLTVFTVQSGHAATINQDSDGRASDRQAQRWLAHQQ